MKKAIIATFVFFAMQIIVPAVGTYVISVLGGTNNAETDISVTITNPTVVAVELLFVYLLTIAALYAWRLLSPISGLEKRRGGMPVALTIMLLLIVIANIANEIIGLPDMTADKLPALMNNPLCIFCIVLVAPIAEELVFRQAVIGALLEKEKSSAKAIVLSAVLFAIVHVNPAQMPVAFVIGILLGWFYVRTGSVVTSAACHVLNNTLGVISFHALPDTKLTSLFGGTIGTVIVTTVCIVVGVLLIKMYIGITHKVTIQSPVPET